MSGLSAALATAVAIETRAEVMASRLQHRISQSSKTEPDRAHTGARRNSHFLHSLVLQGPDRAVPKTILALMNVDGLTRENVASHLQKYRAYLRRIAGLAPGAPLPPQQLPALQQVKT